MESKNKNSSFEEFKKTYIYEIIINPFKLKNLLYNKYGDIEEDFNLLYLDAILFSKNCHISIKYREYLIWDYIDEFLKRYYTKKESYERLPRIANYYKNYLRFFCNPFFKEFKKNDLIQIYGDDKAKVYYKDNYGGKNRERNSEVDNNNIDNNNPEEENLKKKNENEDNEHKNSENYKSLIFNTTVRSNIENNIITRSSVNTKNEYSKNFDSFFDSSFSNFNNFSSRKNNKNFTNFKKNDEEFNNNFNRYFNNDNNISLINNKIDNNKKNIQESLINLLNKVNSNSFTYDFITDENFNLSKNNNKKENFDIKTGGFNSNKIRFKQAQNNLNKEMKFPMNKEILDLKTDKKNFNFNKNANLKVKDPFQENKNSHKLNLNNLNNDLKVYEKNPISDGQELNLNAQSNNNIIKNNNQNKLLGVNPSLNNLNTRNSPVDINLKINQNLNLKNKLKEHGKNFNKMYNEILKESTNKLIDKHLNIQNINNLNINRINNANQNIYNNLEIKKNSKEKSCLEKKSKNYQGQNTNNPNVNKVIKNKCPSKEKNKENEIKVSEKEFQMMNNCKIRTVKENPKDNSKEQISPNSRHTANINLSKEKYKLNKISENEYIPNNNNLYNIKNSTNNFKIEGNNNVVINFSPRLDMDLNQLQNIENLENKLDISPEKLLYNISNRMGSPILNSIVNINIKPILQVNNNQSNVNIYNANANVIKNTKLKQDNNLNHNEPVYSTSQKTKKNESFKSAIGPSTNPPNKSIQENFNSFKTNFLEFKNNKVFQNKTNRLSSLSNNSNKSKEISKKFSQLINNINDHQLNALNMNYSLNRNTIYSTIKNKQNNYSNIVNKNSASQTGRLLKMIKANFESGKRNQHKNKSFDLNSSQGNLFNFNGQNLNLNIDKDLEINKANDKINNNKFEIKKLISPSNYSESQNYNLNFINSNKINLLNKNSTIKNNKLESNQNSNIHFSNNVISNSLNQNFNNFINSLNQQLLHNYHSAKGGNNILTKNNDEQDRNFSEEAKEEESDLKMLEKHRVASADLKNDILTLQKLKGKNSFFEIIKKNNKSVDNIKNLININNTTGNSKDANISKNYINSNNSHNNQLNTNHNESLFKENSNKAVITKNNSNILDLDSNKILYQNKNIIKSNIGKTQSKENYKDINSPNHLENKDITNNNTNNNDKISSSISRKSDINLNFLLNHVNKNSNFKIINNNNINEIESAKSQNKNNKNFLSYQNKINKLINSISKANQNFNNNNLNKNMNLEEKGNVKNYNNLNLLANNQLSKINSNRFGEFKSNSSNSNKNGELYINNSNHKHNNISSNLFSLKKNNINDLNQNVNLVMNDEKENNNQYNYCSSNFEKISPFKSNSSFREKIELINNSINNNQGHSNSNINNINDLNKQHNHMNKSIKNSENANFGGNVSNTKLNNYILNSNNIASMNTQAMNYGNIISIDSSINAKNSTLNYPSNKSSKISNSLQQNKIANLNNNNTIKILSSLSKGNLINTLNLNSNNNNYSNNHNTNITNLQNNINVNHLNSNNKKSMNTEKANNFAPKKKISILKKNFNIENKFPESNKMSNKNYIDNNYENKAYRNYIDQNNNSSSPIKNKSDNLSLEANKFLDINSRNKSSALFKLNTNPSNNSKIVDRFNNSENRSASQNQGTISNENGNILNMKLFDYIKNQDYIDLLKDTVDFNKNNNNNIKTLKGNNLNNNNNFSSLNYNKQVKNNQSLKLTSKNFSNLSKNTNSKTSSLLNNKNSNFIERTENLNEHFSNNLQNILMNFNSSSKEKNSLQVIKNSNNNPNVNLNQLNNNNIESNNFNNINQSNNRTHNNKFSFADLQFIKDTNEEKQISHKQTSEISNANNFMNNKPINLMKKQENASKKNNANSNHEIWINNPYIINTNNAAFGSNSSNNVINSKANQHKTSKNKSIDGNIFLNNNNAFGIFQNNNVGNKFSSLNRSKKKENKI